MSNSLLGFGIVSLVAAIVGGGLKAFGFELPVLKSTSRQIILAAAGIIFIISAEWTQIQPLVFPPKIVTETPTSITLEPGEAHNISLSLSRGGPVDVVVQSLIQDWKGFSGQQGQIRQNELHVTICSSVSGGPCNSQQMGVSQVFREELPAGPGRVSIFNFATNPRITFTIQIKHPA